MPTVELGAPDMEFTKHLRLNNNKRIIFSGRYGIGKSTFLKKYFEDRSEYFTVVVSPINYSVTSNEDIFSMIKFDVLYDLLLQDEVELDMEISDESKEKILSDLVDLTKDVVGMFSALGKSFYELSDKIIPLIDKIKGWNDTRASNRDADRIREFIAKAETNHFLRGYDCVDDIINQSLNNIQDKEKILIVEDLDRIDPDHIFRLFNIFSAHLDWRKQQNGIEAKYTFDRIIFVCDIGNIKSIFENRYGRDADFNGFIDKFYTAEVFSFDNKMAIQLWVARYIKKLDSEIRINKIELELLIDILLGFVKLGVIGMRSLIKIEHVFSEDVLYNHTDLYRRTRKDFHGLHLFRLYIVLRMIIGDGNELCQRCAEASNRTKQGSVRMHGSAFTSFQEYYLAAILPVLEMNLNGLKLSGANSNYTQLISGEGLGKCYIAYELYNSKGYIYAKISDKVKGSTYLSSVNFSPEEEWRKIGEAFQVIRSLINF